MSLTYAREKFSSIMPELPELFYAHWDALNSDKEEVPLDVDWEGYLAADKSGKLHILTARDSGKLVGYAFLYATRSKQSRNVTIAATDIFYLDPKCRKGMEGGKFLDQIKQMARDLGAKKLYIVQKAKGSIAPLLVRKKFGLEEETYSCLL